MPKTKNNSNTGIFKLFVIVVLYKIKPSDSASLNSLQAAISSFQSGQTEIKILLYDNTPGGQDVSVPVGTEYMADPKNSGLAIAYNYALEIANKDGFDWLLTLDQDTSLPLDFMRKLFYTALYATSLDNIAAIVPTVTSDGQVISPNIASKHLALSKHFPYGFVGISSEDSTSAVNSTSTFRIDALRSVGGYDPRFWFDFSDAVMFHRLELSNYKVFIAGNIHVEHELSVMNLKDRTTSYRYENILSGEEALWDEYMGKVAGALILLKLFYRISYGLWAKKVNFSYFKVALRFLCRRLFYSRKRRMKSWKKLVGRRSIA